MEDRIDDILNKDHVFKDIDELASVIENKFDAVESLIILWQDGESMHHRAYGSLVEILGLIEKAKYIMLRENMGGTIDPSEG